MCWLHSPPINSSYSNTKKLNVDIIDAIEKDIILYKQKGDVILCGDLNARTSCEVNFILNDSPLFDSYKPDDKIKLRKVMMTY